MAFLSAADVERLTGRTRHSAQRRVLDRRGIRYVLGGRDGTEPLVREADLDAQGKPRSRSSDHRWDRIGSIRQLRIPEASK